MFGGEAHDSIVRGGGVPDRSSDTVAAREGLVACVFFASFRFVLGDYVWTFGVVPAARPLRDYASEQTS